MARIGLIAGMAWELPNWLSGIDDGNIHVVRTRANNIGAVVSGVGPKNAADAANILIREFQPDYFFVTGFCGAIDPSMEVGDIILANELCYNGNKLELKTREYSRALHILRELDSNYHQGKIQTFDHAVFSRNRIPSDVMGVDMEAYAVAVIGRENGIPTVIVKSVSDVVPEKKPFWFPRMRLIGRIHANLDRATYGLHQFTRIYLETR